MTSPEVGGAAGAQGAEQQVRREQLAAALGAVRRRIEDGCAAAGRDPGEVTLVVVTKYFPASDVLLLHELGVRHFGENRDQEAAAKFELVRGELAGAGLEPATLHFIGRLQGNKAAHVAGYADVVQSVDRVKLVGALARGARRAGRQLDLLIQLSLDGDTARGGALPEDVDELADAVAVADDVLRLRGVMAVAPLGVDADEAFASLLEVSARLRERHAGATWVSAGMSGDLEAGLRHGATHLRVGTAILGSRASLL